MSPTLSELQDVLDWEAIVTLQAIDEADGATVETIVETTGLARDAAENRCQQLDTLGLVTSPEASEGDVYEITGAGHGAIGDGLYDDYDLVGEADIDELAEQVAELLDRRDALKAELEALRDDAEETRVRAERQFGDRDDVTEEFESLAADLRTLEQALEEA